MALPDPAAAMLRTGQTIPVALAARVVRAPAAPVDRVVRAPVVPAAPVDRVVQASTARTDPAVQTVPVGLVAPVVQTVPAGLVAQAGPDTQAAPASTDRAGLVAPAARGTGIPIGVTSTTRRGAMGPALGDRVSRLDQCGIDRSRRPGVRGTTARSTTGATRKPLYGIPASTHGVSGSSECGFRCK